MITKEMRIKIEEIARVALEHKEVSSYVGRELDLSENELDEVYQILESMLNPTE